MASTSHLWRRVPPRVGIAFAHRFPSQQTSCNGSTHPRMRQPDGSPMTQSQKVPGCELSSYERGLDCWTVPHGLREPRWAPGFRPGNRALGALARNSEISTIVTMPMGSAIFHSEQCPVPHRQRRKLQQRLPDASMAERMGPSAAATTIARTLPPRPSTPHSATAIFVMACFNPGIFGRPRIWNTRKFGTKNVSAVPATRS